MISRSELQRLANREKVALGILEKDYVLTEVLKALSQVPTLNQVLIFKGGTALRKIFFLHWRYSEDLDFSVKHNMAKEELRQALQAWYGQVEQASGIPLTTKMLHKPDGYARVRTQFLGPLSHPGMIYMDLTFDELLCLDPEYRSLLTAPFTSDQRELLVYPLEELLAEKMRSLIERGKSRDYYDVWRLLKEHAPQLDFRVVGTVLAEKVSHKGICIGAMKDFLPKDPRQLKHYWTKNLGQQVSPLPSLEEMLEELRDMLDRLIAPYLISERNKP